MNAPCRKSDRARAAIRRACHTRLASARTQLCDGAQHEVDDGLFRSLGHLDLANGLSIAKYGGAVADRLHFHQTMRNKQNGLSLCALTSDDRDHPFGQISWE